MEPYLEPYPTLEKATKAWHFIHKHSSAWEPDTRDIALMAVANQCVNLATLRGENELARQWADQATAHVNHYRDRHPIR